LKEVLRELTDIFSKTKLNYQYCEFDLSAWVFTYERGVKKVYGKEFRLFG
jgi:hypothetical protein